LAPELFSDAVLSEKADVYAFAMVLWEMLTEKKPYVGKTHLQVAMGVCHGERPDLPPFAPPGLKALIRKCWAGDPGKRPDCLSIFSVLQGKVAMFPSAEQEDTEAFGRYIEANAGSVANSFMTVRTITENVVSPQTLHGFTERVAQEHSLGFFNIVNSELDGADDKRLVALSELLLASVWRAPDLGRFLVQAGTLDHPSLTQRTATEYVHRLVWAVTSYDARAFPSAVFQRLLANASTSHPVTIIQAIAARFQAFDPTSDDKTLFSQFLDRAVMLAANGGAPSYAQLLYFMFIAHRQVCREFLPSFFTAIYWTLMSGHPRAVHDVYLLYSLYYDCDWPMEDPILLEHLEIPEVRYALLSYLVRAYTPESPDFVQPLLRIAPDYQMAGIVLCRMLKDTPALAPHFIFNSMGYLLGIDYLIAIRLLCLLCANPSVRVLISQFFDVYRFLAKFVRHCPDSVIDICGLICKFPITPGTALMLVRSGLLEKLDVAGFSRGKVAEVWSVLVVHASFDKFALPRDFRDLIEYLKSAVWATRELSQYALATLYSLTSHREAQLAIVELGLIEVLESGKRDTLASFVEAIITNCTAK
jgi:hypothetical protein